MQKLLPHLPPAPHGEELARKVDRFEHWPICSVHLWFDREITDLPHAVLLDREIHWMYNKSVLQPWRKAQRQLPRTRPVRVAKIRGPRTQQAIEQALSELAEFFPDDQEKRSSKKPR